MKKLVVIGANNFQDRLIKKAKELGYEVHVFAWKDGAVGEDSCDYFYPVSITEKERILKTCMKIKPDGIVSIASDLAMPTVSFVAKHLGLVANSLRCVKRTTDKYAMRKRLNDSGIYTPKFSKINKNYKKSLFHIKDAFSITPEHPVIVKPTDRSGSRGITKVTCEDALVDAIDRALDVSFDKHAILEEFMDGKEYSCECISYKGKHYFLTTTEKFTTGAPNFIETAHRQPSGLSQSKEIEIKNVVFNALNVLGVKYGASHTEFRIDKDGNIKIIEVGARMGGDFIGSDMVQLSTGYDYLKMVIDVATGQKPSFERSSDTHKVEVRFILSAEDLTIAQTINIEMPERIYHVASLNLPEVIPEVDDSSTRAGYYILLD